VRAFAVSVAALAALLVSVPAQAGVVKGRAMWQLRSPAATSFLVRLQSRSLGRGSLIARSATRPAARPSAPTVSRAILSSYEADILRRINAIRASRGRRPLRVSRQLSAAAAFHTNQMGLRGFFEHESANGAEFWKRIERFYPVLPGRSWSVGENIVWGAPDLSAAGAVREWMNSPPHRENLLSREWREIGLGGAHFESAPGTYRGGPVTIVTADFGTRA
jgi:uncharacterized protein YkwD